MTHSPATKATLHKVAHLDKIDKLGLRPEEYIITASGCAVLYGFPGGNADLDVVISEQAYGRIKGKLRPGEADGVHDTMFTDASGHVDICVGNKESWCKWSDYAPYRVDIFGYSWLSVEGLKTYYQTLYNLYHKEKHLSRVQWLESLPAQESFTAMNRSTIYGIVKDQFLRQARPELNQFTVMAYQTSPFYKKQFDTQAYDFLMSKSDRLMLGRTTVITKRNPELREDFKQALAEVNKQINPSGARVGIMLGPDFSELVLEAVAGQEGLFDWIKNKFKGGNKPYQQSVLEFYTVNTDQRNATLSQGQIIKDVTRLTENQHPIMKLSKCQSANLLLNLSANAVVIKSAALRTMPLYLCGYRLQKDVDFKVNTVSSDDSFDIELLRPIQPAKTDKLTLEQFCKQMNINIQVNDASAVGKRKQMLKTVLAQAARIFKTQSADWQYFIKLSDVNGFRVKDFLDGTSNRCAVTYVEITDSNAAAWWKERHADTNALSHGDEVDAFDDAWALVQEFDEKLMQATANLPIEWNQDYSGDGGTLAFTMK